MKLTEKFMWFQILLLHFREALYAVFVSGKTNFVIQRYQNVFFVNFHHSNDHEE